MSVFQLLEKIWAEDLSFFLLQPLYTALFSHQQQQHKGSQTIFLVRATITSSPGLNEHDSEVQQP